MPVTPSPVAAPTTLRFAVTGSSGFVGRHLVAWLMRQGLAVRCLSRHAEARPGTEHRQLDDYLNCEALVAALTGCDVVVHLAARAHVLVDHVSLPEQTFREVNRDSAVTVARAAQAAGLRRFVLISSIGVNGDHSGPRPFTVNDVPAPAEPYAASKWEAEQAVAGVLARGATDFAVLRPALVYGADCPGNFRLLLRLVHRLPIVPLGGLCRLRSLIYVENLCDAIVHAALHPGAAHQTFLLSDGVDLSVADVVTTLARAFGKPRGRVLAVPEPLLRLLAAVIGKRQAMAKLANALAVDASAFRDATGWVAPILPAQGLAETARGYLAAQRR